MSSSLIDTERGGDSTYDQYTSQSSGLASSPSKSTGQLGHNKQAQTADDGQDQQQRERGERTAENIRYGQGISEGGMGGQTVGQTGGAGMGQGEDSAVGRKAQGYGGKGEMSGDVGA